MTAARTLGLSLAISLGLGSAAFAVEPGCEPVAAAMLKASDQPGVKQTWVSVETGAPEGMAAVLLPDAMHIRESPDAAWRAMPFTKATRRKMAEKALETMPPKACAKAGSEQMGGVATTIYSFSQPNPLAATKTYTSRVWISADGLIRRMLISETGAIDFEYGDFQAP